MDIKQFLTERKVAFDVIEHREVYDAARLAHTLHTPGQNVAKTVLLRADGGYSYIVAVLPANKTVDLDAVSHVFNGGKIELAAEEEIAQHCPECERGVLPPFGSQYAMQTLVDRSLLDDDEIVFEGVSHREAIRMKFADFRHLEEPLVGSIAVVPQKARAAQ